MAAAGNSHVCDISKVRVADVISQGDAARIVGWAALLTQLGVLLGRRRVCCCRRRRAAGGLRPLRRSCLLGPGGVAVTPIHGRQQHTESQEQAGRPHPAKRELKAGPAPAGQLAAI